MLEEQLNEETLVRSSDRSRTLNLEAAVELALEQKL
jgi:hypothetical protein